MLVAEAFLKSLVKVYGKCVVYSDGGTWYPEACNSLGLRHILHSPFEKSIIERAMEFVKDRTECFDDYYPCRKSVVVDCNIVQVLARFHYSYFYIICPNHNQTEYSQFLTRKREKIP